MNVKQLLLAKTGTSLSSSAYHHHSSKTTASNPHNAFQSSFLGKPSADVETLQGEAELLLSFANIARCEITDHPSALDESRHRGREASTFRLPMLPFLSDPSASDSSEATSMEVSPDLAPRSESIPLPRFKPLPAPTRLRTVSFDAHHYVPLDECRSRTPSPAIEDAKTPIVSPEARRPMVRSTRQSHRARRQATAKATTSSSHHHNNDEDDDMEEVVEESSSFSDDDEVEHQHPHTTTKVILDKKPVSPNPSGRSFQAKPRPGVATTTIHRRKFSWKNYPEVRVRSPLVA
jgi:hypothetical protein